MPKLILGTANYTQNYGIKNGKQVPPEEVQKILETAIDNGINFVDTSTAYIDIYSHPIKFIKKINKVEDYLHYVGCSELAHGFDKINDEQWDGVSVDTPKEALKAVKMKMSIIQFPYNVFDHDITKTKFFRITRKHHITTIARSVFIQGLLLMDRPPIGIEYIKKLDDIIHPYGISRKETAFLFACGNSNINYIVVGVDTAEQLMELINLTKYELPWSLMKSIYNIDNVPEQIKYPWLWRL
ncbi:MAG: aldo/keto reductase [Candidatus Omnitrophica bacterium]|nr:aldo/keto reductase [Candidatus Omnitrophota bacterium]